MQSFEPPAAPGDGAAQQFIGQHDEEGVYVYQAFNDEIADNLVAPTLGTLPCGLRKEAQPDPDPEDQGQLRGHGRYSRSVEASSSQ
jgi:hypothetical protein